MPRRQPWRERPLSPIRSAHEVGFQGGALALSLTPLDGRSAGGLSGQQRLTASEGLDSGLGETSFILQQVK